MSRLRTALLAYALLHGLTVRCQDTLTNYFQQEADYTILARLDPTDHTVAVTGTLTYTNHAPDALDSLAIHLWANAYADRDSPLGQQLRRLGQTAFAFAPDSALGGYRQLQFSSPAGVQVSYADPELVWLHLPDPLAPGAQVEIGFDYVLRIPRTFSRMGRSGQSYAVTQWFPRPAVYDRDGWHTMPYLDVGEFHNEFGDYDVTIVLPANGIVAATGELLNPAGRKLRDDRIGQTIATPKLVDSLTYGPGRDTFRYRAEGVIDFAWFASPSFRVDVATAALSRGPTPAYTYYPGDAADDLWDEAAAFLARAAAFADSVVGPYPFPQISAVRGPLGTGGGMEYPMITVIGPTADRRSLDRVLAHEAFHNYFQGLLATDEHRHAWMDEGLTSWLEGRYMSHHYPADSSDLDGILPRFLRPRTPLSTAALLHGTLAAAARNPAPDTHPDSLHAIGYGYAAYTQPQLLFELLDARLGGDVFEGRLRDFYATWGGRHPGPRDLQRALGGEQVDWLFDRLLLDNALPDYALVGGVRDGDSVRLTIDNRGSVASPLPVAFADRDGRYGPPVWVDGFAGRRTVTLPAPPEARRVALDPTLLTPEIVRDDNYYRLRGGPGRRIEPLGLAALTSLGVGERNVVSVVPTLGFNYADRVLLGVGFHNYSPLVRGTRFYVLPQLATRDGSLNGIAGVKHSLYRDGAWWRELEFSLEGRSYHYHYDEIYDYSDRFARLTLGGRLFLAARYGLPVDRRLGLRTHYVTQRFAEGIDAAEGRFAEASRDYAVVEADYVERRSDALLPMSWELAAQAGQGFARASGTLHVGLRYREQPNFIRARLFAGAFLHHDAPEVRALLLPNGITGFLEQQYDYTFEQFLIDRAGASQQTYTRDGSLSLPFPLPVPGSESWLASLSATADAPLPTGVLRLQGYLDAALYPDTRRGGSGTVLPVTGGVRVSLFGGLAEVSLPVFNSSFVREALPFNIAEPNYWDRVAFRFDLRQADVDEWLRRLRG